MTAPRPQVPPYSGASVRDDRQLNALKRRWLTPGGNQIAISVLATTTAQTIQLLDTMSTVNYGVSVMPNWNTTVWVSLKGASAFNVNFGTAAPANATIDVAVWATERT